MSLMQQIIARAQSNKQRIVLPESLEERTITAADKAQADGLAEIILIGNREEILTLADKLGLSFETVHSYTKILRAKLQVNNSAALVRKAIEQKLV